MRKIVVTGANGVGKSHFAAALARARPEIPVICFDAIKLKTGWQQRPRPEIEASLAREINKDAWILEGGPSLLPLAIGKAEALVWLDPPERVRAWQLLTRPWKFLGQTRPELPPGNMDWPWQQYKFALRSLRNRRQFHMAILGAFGSAEGLKKWRCRTERDRADVIETWASGSLLDV